MWESPATWGSRWCPFIPGSWSVIEAIYLPTLSGSASKPALKPTRLGPDPARSWPWTKNTWNLTGQAFYLQNFFIFVQQMSGVCLKLGLISWGLCQRRTEILKMLQNSSITVALEEFEKIENVPRTLFLFICPVFFFYWRQTFILKIFKWNIVETKCSLGGWWLSVPCHPVPDISA